ncbi:hypothetical protein SAMD00019534_035820 [Acytostelium subglobosum LB1]|uniref:hypothetical protein n=1 Tax=Acytostelium subglobosum LB1 TaxID=1410327 RepID=UPI000644A1D7|nr:hypothetical protein SAMD00019534_035820 [Acytostelium subglobosum LB1]GAM20407.1 hypothetical protein SAMD00019534_035820 [Acytostelium subglobosum LB1]|eukprot:XP_012759928.1 hypothetical protein SAMD00019534_035820 [Acytostelium subglobosum LB1]
MEIDVGDENDSLMDENLPTTVEALMQHSEIRRQLRSQPVYMKYFWKLLLIISVFYFLPSIQFVFFQYQDKAQCYFNFKCAHEFLGLRAFNNVISNAAYIVAGGAFLLILHFTQPKEDGVHGLHTDMSLFYCLGISVLCEGFSSALYHICPSKLNFQFDTTYMLIGSGLLFFTIHQKRHATFTTGAFRAYAFFAIFIFLDFLSLTSINVYIFWTVFFLIFAYVSIAGSGYLLSHKRLQLNPSVNALWIYLLQLRHPRTIDDKPRFFSILIALVLNWALVITSAALGIVNNLSNNFSNLILGVIVLNFLIYLFYYIAMKIKYNERIHPMIWIIFMIMILCWGFGFYFFEIAVTNKFLSFDESMKLNKPCVLFDYFDTHDVWHFFSAVGLFTVMSIVYFIDYDLQYTPRSLIHVF